jgi:hypothetical protein
LKLKEYGLYLTDLSKQDLEGPVKNIIVVGPSTPGQYVLMGGRLPRYSILIDYLRDFPVEHADAVDLGLIKHTPPPGEPHYQSHVTLHRDHFQTIINCTKPGDVDNLGVEYRVGQEPDWHPLGVGIGVNAKWTHDFPSPPQPVNHG